jgi:hypothetical protein
MSGDIKTLGAVISLMSADDLEQGMELARMSGELRTVGDVVARLDMPVVSALLEDRGGRLQQIAVDTVLRSGSTRAIARTIAATGEDLEGAGTEEALEGVARQLASRAMAADSAALAEEGAELATQGLIEVAVADAAADLAGDLIAEPTAEKPDDVTADEVDADVEGVG